MTLWKCGVCGYIHEDDEPPEECPKCGATKENFTKLPEEHEQLIIKSRDTNNSWMELVTKIEECYDLAESITEDNLDPSCVELAERSMQDFEEITQSIKAEIRTHVLKGKWG